MFQAAPAVLVDARASFSAFSNEQLQALILLFLRLDARAFNLYLVFFGFWCVLIGWLIFRSTFIPRILGVLEAAAGLCWITFVWPPLGHSLSPYNQILSAPGEISLMLWLLIMGVNSQRWKEQAASRPQVSFSSE